MEFLETPILGTPLIELVFCFVFYSVCGYIAEVFYAALVLGRFVNRGFLSGPYCPIYGLAVMLVDMILSPLAVSPLAVFIGGVAVIDSVEYFGGLLLFKAFHQRWWDYTGEPFNIGGFICLSFSLVWGFFSLVVIYILIPLTRALISHIPDIVTAVLCAAVLVYMLVDLIVTVLTIKNFNKKLEQLSMISGAIRRGSDRIGKAVSDRTLAVADAIDLKEKTEKLNEFKASLPDPREVGLKETAESLRDGISSEAKEALDRITARLTRGEKRILGNLTDSPLSRYRDVLGRLREKTGIGGIAGIRAKFTSVLTIKAGESGKELGRRLSASLDSLSKLFWIFFLGSAAGFIFEALTAAAKGYPISAALTVTPLYGISAAALTMALWGLRRRGHTGTAAIFIASSATGAALQYLCGYLIAYLSGSESAGRSPASLAFAAVSLALGVIGTMWIKRIAAGLIPLADRIKGIWAVLIPAALSAAVIVSSALATYIK